MSLSPLMQTLRWALSSHSADTGVMEVAEETSPGCTTGASPEYLAFSSLFMAFLRLLVLTQRICHYMADASLHTLLWWPVATWINCFSSWWWLLAVIIIICIYKNTFHLRISKCFCAHLIKLHNILWGKCQECCYIHFYAGFSKKTRSVPNATGIWFTSHLHRTEQLAQLQELGVPI